MKRTGGSFVVLAALAGVAAPLLAAQRTPGCAVVYDDAQRLACYDAEFGKPVRPDAPQVAPARAAAPPATVAAAPAASVPAAAAATSAAPARPMPAVEPPAAAKPRNEPITARIARVVRIANERFQVTLDSGQVWTQLERDLNAEVAVGDTVTIRPGMLGSWQLETRGGVRTRVRLAP